LEQGTKGGFENIVFNVEMQYIASRFESGFMKVGSDWSECGIR
jgi:hypothetical protein